MSDPIARVLLVDGDSAGCKPVLEGLPLRSVAVEHVATAARCVEVAGRMRPDVIVISDELPDGDGWKLVPLLKRMSLVVIAVTAEATSKNVRRALLFECDALLEKPLDASVLFVQIRRLLEPA